VTDSVATSDRRSPGHTAVQPLSGTRLALLAAVGVLATLAATAGLHRHRRLTELALAALVVAALVVVVRSSLPRLRLTRALDWVVYLLPLAAIVGPALALPGRPQLFAFRLLLAVAVPLTVVVYATSRRLPRLGPRSIVVLFAGWYAWLLVTLLWTPDIGAALRYILILATDTIVMAAVAAAGFTCRRLRALVAGLAAVYSLTMLVGVAEVLTGHHLSSSMAAHGGKAHAATGFFFNPNDLGTYIAMAWPFLLLALVRARARRPRLLALAGLALGVACLLNTGSRSSLIAIGLTTLACAAWVVHQRWIRHRITVVVAAVIVLAALGGLALNTSQNAIARTFQLQNLVQGAETGQSSGGVRVNLTRAGFTVSRQHYFLGVGPGNAEVTIKRLPTPPPAGLANPHDWWLEVFIDGGLPAFAIYVVLYLSMFLVCLRVARTSCDRFLATLAAATGISLIGYVIGSLGPSTVVSFAPMWILFGLALAVARRASLADRRQQEEPAATRAARQ
jgi:teichuronic acid biosynthesis protein TuaE